MNNINDIFFEGHYKDIWKAIIPAELSVKEVDFMVAYFKLQPGHRVLDLMCGYGRHAVGLAEKGISVTAVDNLGEYTRELEEVARERKLPLVVVEENVVRFRTEEKFDLAICMGNSLNFFNADDAGTILRHTASALHAGAYLLLNSWSVTEIAVKHFREKTWNIINGMKVLSDSGIFSDHPGLKPRQPSLPQAETRK